MTQHPMMMLAAVLGQVDPAPAAEGTPDVDAGAAAAQITSVFDFVMKGGVMMIPIGIASLLALAVVAERLLVLRKGRIVPSDFLPSLHEAMQDPRKGHAKALAVCERSDTPIARICAAGIRSLRFSVEIVQKHIADAGAREIFHLRNRLRVLSVIASVTPLMGLVGTIFGMIKAFQTVATSGEALGRTELLATGIYEAMITTAAGLLVAIPSLIFYHLVSARIDRLVAEMDRVTVDFVEEHAMGEAPVLPAIAGSPAREHDNGKPVGAGASADTDASDRTTADVD